MIKRIHLIWLGNRPSFVDESVLNVRRMNPDFEVLLWNESSLASEMEPYQYEHHTAAGASNVIRLHVLRKYGGIYVDPDFIHLKSFDQIQNFDLLTAFVARQPDGCLCNACFGAEPNHPWINAMVDNYGDQRVRDAAWGCHIMEPYLTPDVTILPTDTLYPYNWNESPKPPTENTIAYHLWHGSWTK